MLHFALYQVFPGSRVLASFDDEPDPRKWILHDFLNDMYDQEDLYLAEIAKAEAGETITDLYNNYIHVYLYPDHYPDQVVLEDMSDPSLEDESAEGPRRCTTLTLAEAKQLILDWLAAKEKWYAEKAAATAEPPHSPPVPTA